MATARSVLLAVLATGMLVLSGCATISGTLPVPYTTIAGTWGFAEVNECAEDPRDFVFSRDGKRMSAMHKGLAEAGDGDLRSRFEYKVLAATPKSLHVALEGETRLNESGQPVTWDLVVFDTNTLRWRRSDWPQDEFTSELVRCEI